MTTPAPEEPPSPPSEWTGDWPGVNKRKTSGRGIGAVIGVVLLLAAIGYWIFKPSAPEYSYQKIDQVAGVPAYVVTVKSGWNTDGSTADAIGAKIMTDTGNFQAIRLAFYCGAHDTLAVGVFVGGVVKRWDLYNATTATCP